MTVSKNPDTVSLNGLGVFPLGWPSVLSHLSRSIGWFVSLSLGIASKTLILAMFKNTRIEK